MKQRQFENRKFRLCVQEAKKCIIEIDEDSLHARYLLSQLIYDNESISNIDFSKLNWKNVRLNYSDVISAIMSNTAKKRYYVNCYKLYYNLYYVK